MAHPGPENEEKLCHYCAKFKTGCTEEEEHLNICVECKKEGEGLPEVEAPLWPLVVNPS